MSERGQDGISWRTQYARRIADDCNHFLQSTGMVAIVSMSACMRQAKQARIGEPSDYVRADGRCRRTSVNMLRWSTAVHAALKVRTSDRNGSALPPSMLSCDLPEKLVVSLTSYRKRFDILHLTLQRLLTQSLRADRTVLWIAHEERELLPEAVLVLQEHGLDIRFCEDIKSYKKIIPTLREEPAAFIATADDDVRYPENWLEGLVRGWSGDMRTAVAWRAHCIALDPETGLPLPYRKWQWNPKREAPASSLTFPTGVGGVLYPPGIFHPDVGNRELFESLCPSADDIWLYWMCRRNEGRFKMVGQSLPIRHWPGSQFESLWHKNLILGNNDRCIKNMLQRYGGFGPPAGARRPSGSLPQADTVA